MADISAAVPSVVTPEPARTNTPIVGGKPLRSGAACWPMPMNLIVQGPALVGAVVAVQMLPGRLLACQVRCRSQPLPGEGQVNVRTGGGIGGVDVVDVGRAPGKKTGTTLFAAPLEAEAKTPLPTVSKTTTTARPTSALGSSAAFVALRLDDEPDRGRTPAERRDSGADG